MTRVEKKLTLHEPPGDELVISWEHQGGPGEVSHQGEVLADLFSDDEHQWTVPLGSTSLDIALEHSRVFKLPLWVVLQDGQHLKESEGHPKGILRLAVFQALFLTYLQARVAWSWHDLSTLDTGIHIGLAVGLAATALGMRLGVGASAWVAMVLGLASLGLALPVALSGGWTSWVRIALYVLAVYFFVDGGLRMGRLKREPARLGRDNPWDASE